MEKLNKAKGRKKLVDIYACQLCNQNFKSLTELNHHAAKHDIQFLCNIDARGNMLIEQTSNVKQLYDENAQKRHKCSICGMAFKFLSYLKRHQLKHALDKESPKKVLEKYSCEICQKKFPFPSYLKRHLLLHSDAYKTIKKAKQQARNVLYCCPNCGKLFRFLRNMKRHLKFRCKPVTVKAPKTVGKCYKCDMCNKSYRFSSSLSKHRKNEHFEQISLQKQNEALIPKRSFICETCGKGFNTKGGLKAHDNVHTKLKLYYCDICRQSFTHTSSLKMHYYTHSGERPFECEVCGKCFAKNYSLVTHSRLHTGNLFKCDQCDKAYSTKSGLENHVITHTGIYPFECEKCKKQFRKKYGLRDHLNSTCDVVNKQTVVKVMKKRKITESYPCTVCSKIFKNETNLEQHKLAHDGNYPFNCTVCKIGFIKKRNYLVHLKQHEDDLMETGETKSQNTCEICGTHFKFRYNLRIHMRRHTGELPYECSYCQKKFNSNNILKNHIAAIHTKDYPLRCPICDQGFCKKHKLSDHLKTHSKLKSGVTEIMPVKEEVKSEDEEYKN